MLLVDGAIDAGDGGLDVAERGVDPLAGWRASGGGTRAGLDHLVTAPGVGDGGEAGQAIADDHAVWVEAALGETRDRMVAEAGDPAQLQAYSLPPGVVSTAATNGVLPAAPRPRFPPERSPPR